MDQFDNYIINKIFKNVDELDKMILKLMALKWQSQLSNVIIDYPKLIIHAIKTNCESLFILCKDSGFNNFMAYYSARYNNKKLCLLAISWGANNYKSILEIATTYGHKDLCHIAKNYGATNFNDMLAMAACMGYKDLCILAKKWGETKNVSATKSQPINFNDMIYYAYDNGYMDIYELAKKWGGILDSPSSDSYYL